MSPQPMATLLRSYIGHGRKGPESPLPMVGVRLPQALVDAIDAEARQRSIPRSAVIREQLAPLLRR
jgi:hypothetical protein